MVQTTGRLSDGKPIIDVVIVDSVGQSVDPLPYHSIPTIPVRPFRALIDTGASISCVCKHVAISMNLRPYGRIPMIGSTGQSYHRTFIITLGLMCGGNDSIETGAAPSSLFQIEPGEVAEIENNSWFDLIIGTDILTRFTFTLHKGGDFKLDLS